MARLAAGGFSGFTVEGVAEESGVSKSTIYRHWPTKLAILRDALEELNQQPDVELEEGAARAQVERLLQHLIEALHKSIIGACIPALIEAAERHPEVAELLHQYSDRRRARLAAVLLKGVRNGEFSKHLDPDLAASALAGPIFYRRLMTGSSAKPNEIGHLVQLILGPG